MAAPDELGDRAAHRVADRDDPVEAERVGEGGDVVGALLEAERLGRADAAAVAAVVEGDDVEVLGERRVARPPVEVGRRRPAVQQHERRRAGRSGELAHERAPATGEPDVSAAGHAPAVPGRRSPSVPPVVSIETPPRPFQESAALPVIRAGAVAAVRRGRLRG